MMPPEIDTPPQLQGLYGLGVPVVPFLIAGTGAAAAVSSWLGDDWDLGTYNVITSKINDTIKNWDQQGWRPNNCWGKYPQKRKEFKEFWARWSKHYGQYGKQSVYLSDSAETPVRKIFLPELAAWAQWLNTACNVDTGGPIDPVRPDDNSTDLASIVKWGAIGIGAIVLLNVVQGVRGAFPNRP
jgi:hypothetical protein